MRVQLSQLCLLHSLTIPTESEPGRSFIQNWTALSTDPSCSLCHSLTGLRYVGTLPRGDSSSHGLGVRDRTLRGVSEAGGVFFVGRSWVKMVLRQLHLVAAS